MRKEKLHITIGSAFSPHKLHYLETLISKHYWEKWRELMTEDCCPPTGRVWYYLHSARTASHAIIIPRNIITTTNSRALVRQRNIPTERSPLVAKLVPTLADRRCRVQLVPRSWKCGSTHPLSHTPSCLISQAQEQLYLFTKLIKHNVTKTHEGVDVQIHVFLDSCLVEGEWSASRPGRCTHGERVPGTHWIGGCVDPRAGLDDVEKNKILTLPEI
jgi:hypothetical protein